MTTQIHPLRTAAALQSAAAAAAGTISIIGDLFYASDPMAVNGLSCGQDLVVDGVIPAGQISFAHFGLTPSATDQSDKLATVVAACQGRSVFIPDGTYAFDTLPSPNMLKGVFLEGSPRVHFSNKRVLVASSIHTGSVETCAIGAVLRYFDEGEATSYLGRTTAGYYLIADKPGARHEPVLVAGVKSSGGSTIVVESLLSAHGLSPGDWTPVALNATSDEGNTRSGILWGGSVGTSEVRLVGAFACQRQCILYYENGALKGTNAPYVLTGSVKNPEAVPVWVGDSNKRCLRIYRDIALMRGGMPSAGQQVVVGNYCREERAPILAYFERAGTQQLAGKKYSFIDLKFFTLAGERIQNHTDDLAFSISDSAMQPNVVQTNINPGIGKNIWLYGMFRRKPQGYYS